MPKINFQVTILARKFKQDNLTNLKNDSFKIDICSLNFRAKIDNANVFSWHKKLIPKILNGFEKKKRVLAENFKSTYL